MILDDKPITIKCAVCGEEYEIYPIMSMFVAEPIQYFLAKIDVCPHCKYVSFNNTKLIPMVKHTPHFYMQTDIYKKIMYEYITENSLSRDLCDKVLDKEFAKNIFDLIDQVHTGNSSIFVCRAWLFLYNHSRISYKIKYHKAAKVVRQYLNNKLTKQYEQVTQFIHNLALNDKPTRNSVSNYLLNLLKGEDKYDYYLCNFLNSFEYEANDSFEYDANNQFKHIDIPDFYKQEKERQYFGILLHNNIIMFFEDDTFKYIRFFNYKFYTLEEFVYFIDNYASTYKDYLKLYNKKAMKNAYIKSKNRKD